MLCDAPSRHATERVCTMRIFWISAPVASSSVAFVPSPDDNGIATTASISIIAITKTTSTSVNPSPLALYVSCDFINRGDDGKRKPPDQEADQKQKHRLKSCRKRLGGIINFRLIKICKIKKSFLKAPGFFADAHHARKYHGKQKVMRG